jgi:hypothetical protein
MHRIDNISDILKESVVWIKRPNLPEWYAFIDEEECELVMNDFPAECLYTLSWRGQSVLFDDAPANWSIPRA